MGSGRLLVALLLVAALPATAAGQAAPSAAEPPSAAATRNDLERRQAAIPKPTLDRFSINGALLGTVQWIVNSNAARGSVFGAGSLDLNVTVRPSESVRFVLDVEGLAGPGPDQKLGWLSRLHNDAERLEGAETRLLVRKLFLRLSWLNEHVRFSIGKVDVGDYFDRNFFAEDETTRFLDAALGGVMSCWTEPSEASVRVPSPGRYRLAPAARASPEGLPHRCARRRCGAGRRSGDTRKRPGRKRVSTKPTTRGPGNGTAAASQSPRPPLRLLPRPSAP